MTVTVAVSLAAPEVAVTVAEPLLMEVTKPADETVATNASEGAQLRPGLAIVLSFASLTMAVSWVVLPSAENVSTVSDSSIAASA